MLRLLRVSSTNADYNKSKMRCKMPRIIQWQKVHSTISIEIVHTKSEGVLILHVQKK